VTVPILTKQRELDALCDRLSGCPEIAFDTEFVSEDTFHPELCLIQIATREEMAVVDPQTLDVTPFWQLLTVGNHVTVLHAGREELNFQLRSTSATPRNLFDVQLAAGFCSHEFPAAYGSLVNRFLKHKPRKGEQRTDWRRRPLTDAQVDYALEDVRHLLPLYDELSNRLAELERSAWFEEEIESWVANVTTAIDRRDWRRVSGVGKLGPRELAIVRELWHWRYEEAERLNSPPKRLLRDDLLVEIARRKIDRPDQILAIRGLQRNALKRKADELAACVRRGLEAPTERRPKSSRRDMPPQLDLLGQFLTPALTTICRRAQVAASLVGTASDVRDMIAHRMGFGPPDDSRSPAEQPVLLKGWRAELVGNLIDELLAGKKSISIRNGRDPDPLVFEHVARPIA
jgi:ribonuclease D